MGAALVDVDNSESFLCHRNHSHVLLRRSKVLSSFSFGNGLEAAIGSLHQRGNWGFAIAPIGINQ